MTAKLETVFPASSTGHVHGHGLQALLCLYLICFQVQPTSQTFLSHVLQIGAAPLVARSKVRGKWESLLNKLNQEMVWTATC